ncbi:MAG: hypothetical protein AAF489_02865 [Bacteroidota bacterium]
MSSFLQVREVLPFYDDPTIQEAGVILTRLFIIVLCVWLYRILKSVPSVSNAWQSDSEISLVSPFLLKENEEGALYFSVKKNRLAFKLVAVVLILLFALVPLGAFLGSPSFTNGFYY